MKKAVFIAVSLILLSTNFSYAEEEYSAEELEMNESEEMPFSPDDESYEELSEAEAPDVEEVDESSDSEIEEYEDQDLEVSEEGQSDEQSEEI